MAWIRNNDCNYIAEYDSESVLDRIQLVESVDWKLEISSIEVVQNDNSNDSLMDGRYCDDCHNDDCHIDNSDDNF